MKTKLMFCTLAIVTLAFAAQESIKLERKYKEGEKDVYKIAMQMNMGGDVNVTLKTTQTVKKVFGKPEAAAHLKALYDEFAKIDKWNLETLESTLKSLAQKLGCKTGDLVHPARVAVSGRSVGPSLYHMLEVMGKDRVLKRFERMIAKMGTK